MPTTPVYAFPYPSPGDPPDGPGGVYGLANAVESKLNSLQRVLSGTISGSNPGIVANLFSGKGALIEVSLQAANYYYRYLLWASHSPFNANSGQVTVLATHILDNTAALGPVTQWTVSAGNLFAVVGGAGSTTINWASRNTLTGG